MWVHTVEQPESWLIDLLLIGVIAGAVVAFAAALWL